MNSRTRTLLSTTSSSPFHSRKPSRPSHPTDLPSHPPLTRLAFLPPSAGSYPTVSSHTGEWQLNPSSHSLDWTAPLVNADERSGTMEFSVGGDDVGAFFPVKVHFVGQGNTVGVRVGSVTQISDGEEVTYSEDAVIMVEQYEVV